MVLIQGAAGFREGHSSMSQAEMAALYDRNNVTEFVAEFL